LSHQIGAAAERMSVGNVCAPILGLATRWYSFRAGNHAFDAPVVAVAVMIRGDFGGGGRFDLGGVIF
jgi:hypothetical protein